MTSRRLCRSGRIVSDEGGPVLQVGSECAAAGCAGRCGRRVAEHRIPLRWMRIGGPLPRVGDRAEISVRAPGLTRVAAICFGLPLLAMIGAGWLAGVISARVGLAGDTLPAMAGLLTAGAVLAAFRHHGPALVRHLELRVISPGTRHDPS